MGDFSNEKRKKRKEKTGESCQSVDLQEDPHADLVPLQHLLARLPHVQLPLDVTFSAALLQVEGRGGGLRLGGVRIVREKGEKEIHQNVHNIYRAARPPVNPPL